LAIVSFATVAGLPFVGDPLADPLTVTATGGRGSEPFAKPGVSVAEAGVSVDELSRSKMRRTASTARSRSRVGPS